ncbi:hypothetical protein L7F22_031267 [Adiantum nelumboides]|nr:hypothetical protein [Adiantum nelumboides]MCO5577435.1 hypothetical protein [Adiantum nelumboides]
MAEVINKDVLYEVLCRLDGLTLATAACAGSVFRSISLDERIWECICNKQWPSTNDPLVKYIAASMGGFYRFYSECFPLIVNKQPFIFDIADTILKDAEDWFDDEEDMIEELYGTSPDDFVSLVDVLFKGKPIVTRVLHGIPGASDFHGWFSTCPFRIDALTYTDDDDEQAVASGTVISEDLPSVVSIEKERKEGRFWKALRDDIRVSWIIVNKRTRQMANLSSWRPLGGQRHWPSDKQFLVRFGSILPAHPLLSRKVVQCNVVLKCKLLTNCSVTEARKSTLVITELSLQLEDMAGAHLNGRHSVLALMEALSCRKSMNHNEVLKSYRQYIRVQSELKEEKLKSEGWIDTICIIWGIISFVSFFCYMF